MVPRLLAGSSGRIDALLDRVALGRRDLRGRGAGEDRRVPSEVDHAVLDECSRLRILLLERGLRSGGVLIKREREVHAGGRLSVEHFLARLDEKVLLVQTVAD